ncbi:MAG: type II toxin-antitoxin system HicA family toxin [Endomicrobium sp.]|nr:type II toxin-antitoxin system HicA family toxin [Endomicrobium sp.]
MPKMYSSRELIKIIEDDGWFLVGAVGSHHQFKHHTKSGKITIPHPKKDIALGTMKTIFKQANLTNKEDN